MKGKIQKRHEKWVVWYFDSEKSYDIMYCGESLPLHPDDLKQIQQDAQVFDNIEARIAAYPDVDFEIVEVRVIGGLKKFAKLIPTNVEYPELEATMNLCNDMIWDSIYEEYSTEQYPPFGGPFTDSISFIDWLKQNYIVPKRK